MWLRSAGPGRCIPPHTSEIGWPGLPLIDGLRGADLIRHDDGELIEFTVLTRWVSMEAVSAFPGDNLDRAVVEPGAVAASITLTISYAIMWRWST